MANTDRPNGFKPIRHINGGTIPTPSRRILTASATVYPGECVKAVAGGSVEKAAADDGAIVVGVAAEYKVAPATGTTYVAVYDDPGIVYEVQSTTSWTTTVAVVNSTGNHVATAGDSTYKQAREELDSSGAQFTILGLVDRPGNAWGEHSKLEVVINESTLKSPVAGV
jgi:hypothetical protein